MIELKNVSKTFVSKKEIKAVNDISLTIESGEIYGIVGYSGAGKSTLVRLINQLERSDTGSITIDGVDISKLREKDLRKQRQKIGMIFQNFNLLWSRTVKENIAFPLEIWKYSKDKINQRVDELLEVVSLVDKKDEYPSSLSGGQKQRVGIARALALNPSVLLSDEATSALDPKTTDDILNLLKKINEESGITIVMISHQMEVVQKICQRICVMSDGKIIEEGNTKDIFRSPKNELTKKLIRNINSDQNDIEELKKQYPSGHLLRLVFDSNSANRPILADIASKNNIKFNIVNASIKSIDNSSMGVMYVHIEEDMDKFIAELIKNKVEVEVC